MAKKQVGVSLRKPPPVDVDAFVAGDAKPKPSEIRALAPVKKIESALASVTTPNGREMREMTILLPVDLARKVSLACADSDRDASNLVADAIATHLNGRAPEPRRAKLTASSLSTWTRNVATLFRQRLFAI